MAKSYEVVVVGGGIAGSALALKLASQGVDVAVLERDLEPLDRVRGEYVPPWGVVELQNLGLLDLLVAGGGIFARKNIPFDENTPRDAALPLARDMASLLPAAPGSLCMSHPLMCSTLAAAAIEAGATFLRGIKGIEITTGEAPTVAFSHEHQRLIWQADLVIGADGRNSQVRRQAGLSLTSDPPHGGNAGRGGIGLAVRYSGDRQRRAFILSDFPSARRTLEALPLLFLRGQDRLSGTAAPAKCLEDIWCVEVPAICSRDRAVSSVRSIQFVLQRRSLDRRSSCVRRGSDRRCRRLQ